MRKIFKAYFYYNLRELFIIPTICIKRDVIGDIWIDFRIANLIFEMRVKRRSL